MPYTPPHPIFVREGSGDMARKALKLASWTSVALAASGVYLYSNNYLDPNDFGAVRVGRAVATTAVISYDYLTSLRSVPYGSEEYLQRRSQVYSIIQNRFEESTTAGRKQKSGYSRGGSHQLLLLELALRLGGGPGGSTGGERRATGLRASTPEVSSLPAPADKQLIK
ncbi:hypothetical protein U0070_007637 [Myodes glareolus]|uniref:Uncharacterized protein n=1 Tax=Myodes glareolus TaxID=447135 RepID=A0AAW0IZR8_MYOGA